MLKAYTVGFVGALVAILVVTAIWFAARPAQEPGLVWGGTVYTSKQEFNRYLKSKGLSYRIWLERNPGAAPWEPAVATRTGGASGRSARPASGAARENWVERLPVAAIGAMLGVLCALLLLVRALRPHLARPHAAPVPSASAGTGRVDTGSSLQPTRPAPIRRLTMAASVAADRLWNAAPLLAGRVAGAARADRRVLPRIGWTRKIRLADAAFVLLAVLTSGMFVVFVVLLLLA